MPRRLPDEPVAGDRAADNLGAGPPRLFGVAEGEAWESELRRCLAEQAGTVVPARSDLTDAVVTSARRRLQRRSAVRLAAVVAATGLAGGVLLQGWHPAPPHDFGAVSGLVGDSVTEQPAPAPVDLTVDGELAVQLSTDLITESAEGSTVLVTADGETLDLGQITEVVAARVVGSGWAVISGRPGSLRLWWVTHNRDPVSLVAGADAIVIEERRVAWLRGGVLATAVIIGGKLEHRVTTTGLGEAGGPVGILGDSVLLNRTNADGSKSWDRWVPAEGDYQPGWVQLQARVYGALPGGASAVGLVPARSGATDRCLGRLSLDPLDVVQTRCLPVDLSLDGPAAVSPGGGWLVAATDTDGPVLIDLGKAFDGAATDAVLPLPDVPELTAAPVWLAPNRVMLTSGDLLLEVQVDQLATDPAAAVEQFQFTGAPPRPAGLG